MHDHRWFPFRNSLSIRISFLFDLYGLSVDGDVLIIPRMCQSKNVERGQHSTPRPWIWRHPTQVSYFHLTSSSNYKNQIILEKHSVEKSFLRGTFLVWKLLKAAQVKGSIRKIVQLQYHFSVENFAFTPQCTSCRSLSPLHTQPNCFQSIVFCRIWPLCFFELHHDAATILCYHLFTICHRTHWNRIYSFILDSELNDFAKILVRKWLKLFHMCKAIYKGCICQIVHSK